MKKPPALSRADGLELVRPLAEKSARWFEVCVVDPTLVAVLIFNFPPSAVFFAERIEQLAGLESAHDG
jgi:hypothetical protein